MLCCNYWHLLLLLHVCICESHSGCNRLPTCVPVVRMYECAVSFYAFSNLLIFFILLSISDYSCLTCQCFIYTLIFLFYLLFIFIFLKLLFFISVFCYVFFFASRRLNWFTLSSLSWQAAYCCLSSLVHFCLRFASFRLVKVSISQSTVYGFSQESPIKKVQK